MSPFEADLGWNPKSLLDFLPGVSLQMKARLSLKTDWMKLSMLHNFPKNLLQFATLHTIQYITPHTIIK